MRDQKKKGIKNVRAVPRPNKREADRPSLWENYTAVFPRDREKKVLRYAHGGEGGALPRGEDKLFRVLRLTCGEAKRGVGKQKGKWKSLELPRPSVFPRF